MEEIKYHCAIRYQIIHFLIWPLVKIKFERNIELNELMKEWWSSTLTGVFFKKTLYKIIYGVIFAYSINTSTTLRKKKAN